MSSIPLPRILQAKKTSGEMEKEQFDKQMVNIPRFYSTEPVWMAVIFKSVLLSDVGVEQKE